jgi:single-strand DNA-binding protein
MTMSINAASVTLVGRAGTHPQLSVGMTGDRVNLRVVATERYFDKAANDWVNGDEFGVTVVCWKSLAKAVLNNIRKGDPVIVSGRIATRRFEKNGVTQFFTEVKADFVGLDVAKTGTRFTRNLIDPRDSAELSAARADTESAETETTDAELDPARPLVEEPADDFDAAPWDAELGSGDRNDHLISVD